MFPEDEGLMKVAFPTPNFVHYSPLFHKLKSFLPVG
jgi:hypothetical protein